MSKLTPQDHNVLKREREREIKKLIGDFIIKQEESDLTQLSFSH